MEINDVSRILEEERERYVERKMKEYLEKGLQEQKR